MATQTVAFNGSIDQSNGIGVGFSRINAITTAAGGTVASAYQPYYGQSRLIVPPPTPITLDTDATALNQVFGGTWTDGTTNALIHYRQRSSPNPAYVNIWVNPTFAANSLAGQPSSRSVNIRCTNTGNKTTALVDLLKGSPDETANTVYAPYSFVAVGGVCLAACEAQNWTGSAWQAQAVGLGYWNEAGGYWNNLLLGKVRKAGQTRGREWAMKVWLVQNVPTEDSTEIFVTAVDYGVNPSSDGGQCFLIRLSRASTSDAWTIGQAIMLFETTNTGNYHYHNAYVYRPSSTSTGIAVGIAMGDGTMSELVTIYRSDSSTYSQGWDGGTKNATASTTNGATQNGWTTIRKSAGCPSTLSSSPAVGWNQWMGVASLASSPTDFVVGNDEGMNPVLKMHAPDPFNSETQAWFELLDYEPVPSPSIRRGRLAFGIWSNINTHRNYVAVARRNSAANSSISIDETQTLNLSANSGGSGNFTLTFEGQTTGAIAWNDDPATLNTNIQNALIALSNVGSGNVSVSGTTTTRTVAFTGTLARTPFSAMTINTGGLSGVTITVSRIQAGQSEWIPVSWSPSSLFLQGFSGAVADQNTRVLYSPDGNNWCTWFSPNADVRPTVCGNYALFGGISSYGKVTAYQFPRTYARQPIQVSPASTQYQINSAAQAEAPSAGNTITSITTGWDTVGGLVAGRSIPKPPSNGPVIRWTVSNARRAGGARTLTTATPLAISNIATSPQTSQYFTIGFWVYALPTSSPYGGDNTAPFNNPRTTFRILPQRYGSSAIMRAAACDVGSLDGSGWRYFTMSSPTGQWGGSIGSNSNVAVRLTEDGTDVVNLDVLICFDQIHISSSATDICCYPNPVNSSATSAPGTISSDSLTVAGYSCSDTWKAAVVGQLPDTGPDQYVSVNQRPTNRRLFTLMDSSNRFIAVSLDAVNRAVVFSDNPGVNSVSVSGPSPETFVFELATPYVIGVSYNAGTITVAVSIGNTQFATGTLTLQNPCRPNMVVFADETVSAIEPSMIHSLNIDEENAASSGSDLASWAGNYQIQMSQPGPSSSGGRGARVIRC